MGVEKDWSTKSAEPGKLITSIDGDELIRLLDGSSDAFITVLNAFLSLNNQYVTEAGSSFTVSSAHKNRIIRCTSNTAVTITVPTGLGKGFACGFLPEGDGVLSWSGAATLKKGASYHLKSGEKNGLVAMHAPVADTFFFSGELKSAAVTTVPLFILGASTACSVNGASDFRWWVPDALDGFDLVGVQGNVVDAGTTGTMDVQIHNVTQAVDMLIDKLQFASGSKISDDGETVDTGNNALTANDEIRIDIDTVHTGTPANGFGAALRVQEPA